MCNAFFKNGGCSALWPAPAVRARALSIRHSLIELPGLIPPGMVGTVVARTVKRYGHHQADISQARANTLIDALQAAQIRGNDRGHSHIIAIVEQLKELLVGPGRGLL